MNYAIEKSVARLPLTEQIPEIERRLTALYNKQKKDGKAMTPAHIAEALAIGKSTLNRWTRAVDEIDPAAIGASDEPDDEQAFELGRVPLMSEPELKNLRKQMLRLWLTKGETLTVDIATNPDSKSAVTGAVKILETAYDYRKQTEVKLTQGGGWEKLMSSIR